MIIGLEHPVSPFHSFTYWAFSKGRLKDFVRIAIMLIIASCFILLIYPQLFQPPGSIEDLFGESEQAKQISSVIKWIFYGSLPSAKIFLQIVIDSILVWGCCLIALWPINYAVQNRKFWLLVGFLLAGVIEYWFPVLENYLFWKLLPLYPLTGWEKALYMSYQLLSTIRLWPTLILLRSATQIYLSSPEEHILKHHSRKDIVT